MKLLHLADLHLGKSVNDMNMIDDQRYILDQILDLVREREIDGVLIAGDVYDKKIPSEEAVNLLDDFLSRLTTLGTAVYMISGNHDSDDRLNFGSSLFKKQNLYIGARYEGSIPRVTAEDEFGPVHIWMLPFVKASRVAHFLEEADTSTYDKAVRSAIAAAEVDPQERNVILAHQYVTAGGDPVFSGSESMAPESVGAVEKVGAACFDDFDYVALGHIHSPQRVGREEVRYAGSPLKYHLSEIHQNKSVPVVTLLEKGNVTVEKVPLKPRREMRRIKGKMKDLTDIQNVTDPDDYIYATLTDEVPIPDAIGKLRNYYNNIMKLDYDNSHTRSLAELDYDKADMERSFEELIKDFYRMMNGGKPDEEEMEILNEAAREAGVIE